ncbi:Myb-like_DNA-binding domain-containing protein [Hexamita inflata]|uniref:Myb-like DNA-binding domain-containing protein n=1 Tax=Hexamita inflata TaxID=28002 RepID=A0AA86TCI6_9EUKA|nr:Myb-like DNA-binding domain-containing protein [Hexamita inflata]
MSRQQHWSESEKNLLNDLVCKYKQNSRVNWQIVSSCLQGRTPSQCKMQYRGVLNKNMEKINFEWTDDKLIELEIIVMLYGTKWKFIQQNYFPYLKTIQLQLRYQQVKKDHAIFDYLSKNAYNLKSISDKDVKVLKLALLRLQLLRKILKNLGSNQPDIAAVDPLELQYYKLIFKGDHVEIEIKQQHIRVLYSYNLDEEEVKIHKLLHLKIVPDILAENNYDDLTYLTSSYSQE